MKTQETYDGDGLLGVDNGLYHYEDIDFEETTAALLAAFEEQYGSDLKEALAALDFKLLKLSFYSPAQYNYKDDSIDVTIGLPENYEKYNQALLKHEEGIDKTLKENKSYDGYMALTVDSVAEEINKQDDDYYTPDIICLGYLLRQAVDFSDWDKHDHMVLQPHCIDCGEPTTMMRCDSCQEEHDKE